MNPDGFGKRTQATASAIRIHTDSFPDVGLLDL